MFVNWAELTISRVDTGEQLYHNSFATNYELTETTVELIVEIQTLTRYLCFDSWDHLLDFMLKQLELDISPAPTWPWLPLFVNSPTRSNLEVPQFPGIT